MQQPIMNAMHNSRRKHQLQANHTQCIIIGTKSSNLIFKSFQKLLMFKEELPSQS